MSQHYDIEGLIKLESQHHTWDFTFFDYPLWIHFREDLIKDGIKADRKVPFPHLFKILKSMFLTLHFLLFTQKKVDKIYFLMEREELLEVYKQDPSNKKALFLNFEQNHQFQGEYIDADFLNVIRYLCRKSAYLFFRSEYTSAVTYFHALPLESLKIKVNIKNAMGDALFLDFLSKILHCKIEKIYSGCIIPIGEKFINKLNTVEVQHGIIHPSHIGYIGLPPVKNTLMLYDKRYENILRQHGYKGTLQINLYKKYFLCTPSKYYYPIVIYTQPILEMQQSINRFLQDFSPTNVFIQRHPKDYFSYTLEKKYFVTGTTPLEVGYPILYLSSVIENFTICNKDCYIYDLQYKGIDIDVFLEIYMMDSKSNLTIMKSLENIYTTILEKL